MQEVEAAAQAARAVSPDVQEQLEKLIASLMERKARIWLDREQLLDLLIDAWWLGKCD